MNVEVFISALGVLVGALGVLFAVLTIVAAVLLYRQSKDHQRHIQSFIDQYRPILEGVIADANSRVEMAIAELKKELQSSEGEQKKRLEETIKGLEQRSRTVLMDSNVGIGDRLRIAIDNLPEYPLFKSGPITSSALRIGSSQRCLECGHEWFEEDDPGIIRVGGTVTCPKCGNVQRERRHGI